MILVLNCILHPRGRAKFDAMTAPGITASTDRPVKIVHLAEDAALPAPGEFTHLVISGSEHSASKRHERDEEVEEMIRAFVSADRAILGICYGHQMIARALAGHEACRRSDRPEFGWRPVSIEPDPIFAGLADPIFAHSHYDEVANLPDEFVSIASTADCDVQAFRVAGTDVVGVQFHPEVTHAHGELMFRQNLLGDPEILPYMHRELGDDPGRLDQNARIFERFFGAGEGGRA
jgi:GMP synthase (glutamine-hydrolysing)